MAFTRRELKEVVLALDYDKNYGHGTAGHNGYALVAKIARSLSDYSPIIGRLVHVFDSSEFHRADDIVAQAIEFSPNEFLVEAPRQSNR